MGWAFGDTTESDSVDNEFEGGYKHRSFAPLPLPSSLSVDDHQDGNNCLVDVLLMNTCSPFADVRRMGWQELARATKDSVVCEALLNASADGESSIELAAKVLDQDTRDNVISDTQRCVLKTLLNVVETTAKGPVKIQHLKSKIDGFTNKKCLQT